MSKCLVPGCEAKSRQRGLCSGHYRRVQKDGLMNNSWWPISVAKPIDKSLSFPGKRSAKYPRTDPKERMRGLITIDKITGCWVWTGHTVNSGYGLFYFNSTPTLAHRASYEMYKGPITSGMEILHSCDNKKCVNPDHLSLGTRGDNIRDQYAKGRGFWQNRRRQDEKLLAHARELLVKKAAEADGGE